MSSFENFQFFFSVMSKDVSAFENFECIHQAATKSHFNLFSWLYVRDPAESFQNGEIEFHMLTSLLA